jgi:hypothetical protein
MSGAKNETRTYSIRGAAAYCQQHGVDVGELRIRTLARTHEIFMNDPNTSKQQIGDSDVEQWRISEKALNLFIEASKRGNVRAGTAGNLTYKVSVNPEQLAALQSWCVANGVAEPKRANTTYVSKSEQARRARKNGDAPALAEFDTEGEGEDAEFEDATA